MKKALALAAILAWVTSANAVVQIFFTNSASGYGLTNPALAFDPSQGAGTDAASYSVASFPPAEAWGAVPEINYAGGEFAYVWVRFVGETNNRKIQGMDISFANPAELAYYVMDDQNGDNGSKRWDGSYTSPNEPEFKQNRLLAAATGFGIRNRPGADDAWNLYDNATRTALLGAVRYAEGTASAPFISSIALGSIPVKYAGITTLPQVATGTASWVPEPASLALLGLAGLLIRRR